MRRRSEKLNRIPQLLEQRRLLAFDVFLNSMANTPGTLVWAINQGRRQLSIATKWMENLGRSAIVEPFPGPVVELLSVAG